MKDEFARRANKTADVLALFRRKPLTWIGVHELAHVGGFAAWRTRVSDARKVLEADGGSLVWNENRDESAYMFKPYVPLGRSADKPAADRWAVPDAPYADSEKFELT